MSTCAFSRILRYWLCNALFFHFSSFIDFIFDLNMFFKTLDLSEADLLSLLLYYIVELKLFAFSTKPSILSRLVTQSMGKTQRKYIFSKKR